MERKVRVRFAPSPTGPLHIGGVRTALYNYLFAKKHGGDFLLRIEDTDQTRYVKGAEDYIVEALKWSGLIIDEGVGVGGKYGPYRQSERKKEGIYKKYTEQLITSGHAYYAFDTPEELDLMRENLKKAGVTAPQYNINTRNSMKNSLSLSAEEVKKRLENNENYVIRIKIPRNEDIKFKDIIRGWVVVNTSNLDDKVLFKSDGMPTYHLANIVDDYLMKITHVIRGEEWLPSAPLHVLLYQYLGWENVMPQFAHLPLILKPDGNGKLSKRDGDRLGFPVFPIQWTSPEGEISSGYKESGYFSDAFINMLAMLGWNPGTTQEIFSREELIQSFSLEKVGKSGSKFDPEKTRWFNAQYLRNKTNEELAAIVKPLVAEKGFALPSDAFLIQYCGLMKERAVFIDDLLVDDYLFIAPTIYDKQTISKKWKDNTPTIVKELRTVLDSIVDFNAINIELAFKNFIEEKKLSFGEVLPNFRVLVTGMGTGPSMFEICALLGKEETVRRIDAGMKQIVNVKI